MVAKITTPKNISRALNYNEKKVQDGKAVCLHAANFLQEADQLNFYQKLERFERQISLNERAATNTLHISLNFDPSEKLDKEKLIEIAQLYMKKIGFKDQPYLIYEHLDAGHPHIHIVTTHIKANGKRIDTYNIGRNQSTRARKEIEHLYGLKKAQQQQSIEKRIQPFVQKLHYGRSETKRGIANILTAVIDQYKYTSLAELNAVLQLYNVTADRGNEEGRIYQHRGLVYRALDEQGNKIGVPVKASSIYNKPTLDYIEKKGRENEILRQADKKHLKTSIDWILIKPPKSLEQFREALQKERISLVIRQNEEGIVYGLTYIDHTTKAVFNGSDMGKTYSAKAILEKCGQSQQLNTTAGKTITQKEKQYPGIKMGKQETLSPHQHPALTGDMAKLWEELINPVEQYQQVPYELRKKRKKKKQ
jgi:hypothetical protein